MRVRSETKNHTSNATLVQRQHQAGAAAPAGIRPAARSAAARQLMHILERRFIFLSDQERHDAVEGIVRRLDGCTLDFSRLSANEALCVRAMGAQGWAALQLCVQSSGLAGISNLDLGPELTGMLDRNIRGLSELETLTHLRVRVDGGGGTLLFGDLADSNHLLIEIAGVPAFPLEVVVPQGARVVAAQMSGRLLDDSSVYFATERGKCVDWDHRLALQGPAPMGLAPAGAAAATASAREALPAATIRLPQTETVAPQQPTPRVQPRETDFERMKIEGPCALFEAAQMGEMMNAQFAGMRPGQSREYMVLMGTLMGELTLQVQQSPHAESPTYVARIKVGKLNISLLKTTDRREIDGFSFRAWARRQLDAGMLGELDSIGRLYASPPSDAPLLEEDRRVHVHVSPARIASASFLYAAMDGGCPHQVADSVRAIAQSRSPDMRQRLLGKGGSSDIPALHAAIRSPASARPAAVSAYASQLLKIPDAVLNLDAKIEHLQVIFHRKAWLERAFSTGCDSALTNFIHEVIGGLHGRPVAQWQHLLILRGPAFGQPFFGDMWAKPADTPLSTLQRGQIASTQAYFHAILNSDLLSNADKLSIVSASTISRDSRGAVRVALEHGNPGAAAAMVLGVLDSTLDLASKTRLLKWMGVSPDAREVVAALQRLEHPQDREWAQPCATRVQAAIVKFSGVS